MKRWVGEGSYRDVEAEIRRLLVAASPGTKLPPISPEATAFAKTGEPSYAGITAETYVGAARREPGTVTLEGSWQSSRQYVELQNGTGKIILPFRAGEVNVVMQPGASGKATVRWCSMGNRSARHAAATWARTDRRVSIDQE